MGSALQPRNFFFSGIFFFSGMTSTRSLSLSLSLSRSLSLSLSLCLSLSLSLSHCRESRRSSDCQGGLTETWGFWWRRPRYANDECCAVKCSDLICRHYRASQYEQCCHYLFFPKILSFCQKKILASFGVFIINLRFFNATTNAFFFILCVYIHFDFTPANLFCGNW